MFTNIFFINFKTNKYEDLLLWIIWLDRLLHLRSDLHSRRTEEWGLSRCLWKYCLDRCMCSLVFSCAFKAKLSGINSLTFIPEIFWTWGNQGIYPYLQIKDCFQLHTGKRRQKVCGLKRSGTYFFNYSELWILWLAL